MYDTNNYCLKNLTTSLRRSNLFFLYAKVFRLLLAKTTKTNEISLLEEEKEYDIELDRLVLPSNKDWRLKVYYRLVELQRESDHLSSQAIIESEDYEEEEERYDEKEEITSTVP